MKKLVLIRLQKLFDRTLGRLFVFSDAAEIAQFVTLELPWAGNAKKTSCIPAGSYMVEPRNSQKHGDHLLVRNVPGRDLILLHAGNVPDETEGCVLVGLRFGDLDKDGRLDTVSSRAAMGLLNQFVADPASLVIVDA